MSQPPWPHFNSPAQVPSRSAPSTGNRSRTAASARRDADASGDGSYPIIAICHLSWDWVWQRPQQFLSRLSRRHPVLFVETYCSDVRSTRVALRTPEEYPQVTLLQMHLPSRRWEDGAFIDAERRQVLQGVLAEELAGQFEQPLLWFNDPMAVVAFAGHLGERGIVYDCMDELSQFKGAPPALLEREQQLLARADIVFCGGQKMRRRRLPLNPNTHFFGTGVDLEHFGSARTDDLAVAPEIAALGGAPVLGYFGVIDERIDYSLIAELADARDDWHVMMVGPTAKVDPADFPQRPNLHWIGARPYSALPALTKGFSVALMPFALNAATEYINPTKALEYMAAGRPVVSTALDEVKLNFGQIARIAKSHGEFVGCCERELERPSRARIRKGLELAAANTWEAIIARMEAEISSVIGSGRRSRRAPVPGRELSPEIGNLAYV